MANDDANLKSVAAKQPLRQLPTAHWPLPTAAQLLWIDDVGGYLVCFGERIVLGPPQSGVGQVSQPARASDANSHDQVESLVAILGDLSPRHATIRREEDDYWIEPNGLITIDGRSIKTPQPLRSGQELKLGAAVRVRFDVPHPLSSTARLRLVSRHRTQPAADGVLLMAEACVLGPRGDSHVVCRDWPRELVLFRQEAGLFCKLPEPCEVDGRQAHGKVPLSARSTISGHGFSLALEPV